ncbi:primosomal protein N' [Putridiphycobacter roseus]|uniref:Replication restart protein PriA n=1 Tax=Putridiphycobacter roseus TaxID=2219161 RepID=A0A2W1N300_9FLAO|nr:primosomal protein N' [Putridiphycobacter roseus]PZE17381.1 primosomal protein N' [Putridiphycobacter roseus]
MTDRITYFVDVVLPLSIPNTYTYRLPFELNDQVAVGKRVIVPLGRAKYYTGVIKTVHQKIPTAYQVKYVETILDEQPIITQKQLTLWDWIASYYMADIGDVMNAAVPSNFKLASETIIFLHPSYERDHENLSNREYLIVEALELQESLTLKEIAEIIQIKTIQPIIKLLIEKKVVIVSEELKSKYNPKYLSFVKVHEDYNNETSLGDILNALEKDKRAEGQVSALLKTVQLTKWTDQKQIPVTKKQLIETGISESSIQTLAKKGILEIFLSEISRLEESDDKVHKIKALSPAQENAFTEIKSAFVEKDICLLHGVTSSGKTEIYVKLIQEALDKEEQVLFLLPEIALTTQLITRLKAYFGDLVGVYHSRFNQNERIEIWNHILNNSKNQYRIVLGARSSVFLPFQNLGLIIVDEEHENSFKQYDPSPRYNARDVSIVLAKQHQAKVLLGSATPALESYFNAKENRYGLVELFERYGGVQLPEIQCADLEKETKNRSMKSHFSSFLLTEMEEALKRKEQIILFQNRRGYTPLWSCEMCNWTVQCKNCDVSLTYHKASNVLKCHYCGYFVSPPSSCGACGSKKLKMLGFGTEKIEDELVMFLPKITVQRLDLDSTRAKNAYQRIIEDFENRKIDVLIGTQMVTKGLDFDNVGLVGVLSADQMLKFPDFRAFERSYQLMSQVAGRAGRKSKRGKVIIQSFDPNHWIIQKVMQHDYIGMYTQEILERKNFNYPPFYRIITLQLRHRDSNLLEVAAAELGNSLKVIFKDRLLGPETPLVGRVRNLFLKNITIKFERTASPPKVKKIIADKLNEFQSQHDYRSVRVVIDVDPQ